MKLNDVRPTIETSGDLEEQFFSIQDQGMIFDILRNKMYSNPILAICREITCNARDAHREVGTPDVPVVIHLPNTLEQYYKVKDFGPGISPDRMSNIFIKYTASTKRNDNTQTGGFGLGAKTPFSYSDSFSIVTNYNGTQYNYSCNIDETKVGKLSLMSQSPTKEPNGTEIIIPVKHKNFTEFATWTEQACRHWTVRPTIRGGTLEWQDNKKILEGTNWAITASQDWQRQARMIIDGIEYPLDLDTLKKYADAKLIDASRGHFIMYFGVGELSLSASREQIYLDEKTQNVIRKRLDKIFNEIKQSVVDKIDALPNLWEANIYYRKELRSAFNDLRFLGPLTWKTHPLTESYVNTGCTTFHFSKGKYSRKYGTNPDKLTRSNNSHLSFEETSALFVNDLPLKEPTPRHVKKAFEDDPKLTSVQVICPTDKITIADLNKSIHLEQLAPKMLSSITKATARNYTSSSGVRLILFKFDDKASAFRQVSYASLEEDSNDKVLCTLTKGGNQSAREPILGNNRYLALSSVKTLAAKFPKFSFYGLDGDIPQSRLDEDFSDFNDIESFIKENVLDTKLVDYVKIKFATTHVYQVNERLLKHEAKLVPLIKDKNSLCIRLLELHNRLKNINTDDLGLLSIYESVNGKIGDKEIDKFLKDNPEFDIEAINNEYVKKYPLLSHISVYNFGDVVHHAADYINMIDKI